MTMTGLKLTLNWFMVVTQCIVFCRRWLLSKYIANHLQSSQGSTRSTGSGHDGFVSMDAIDLNLDLPHSNPPVQNGKICSVFKWVKVKWF